MADRRSRRLKQATDLNDISQFSSVNPVDGDILIYASGTALYENGRALTGDYGIAGQLTAADLLISNDATITDALNVGGNSGLTGDLSVIGTSAFNAAVTIGSTLAVTGAVTLSDALNVAGTLTGSGLSFSGAGSFASLSVSGALTTGTLALTDLNVTGDLTGVSAEFSGNVSVIGTLSAGQLGSSGGISGDSLSVIGTAAVGDALTVQGSISFGAEASIAQVSDNITLLNDAVSGTIAITGTTAADADEVFVLFTPEDVTDMSGQVTGLVLPSGATAAQAGTPTEGTIRYNSDDTNVEVYQGAAWVAIGGGLSNVVEDTTPQLGGQLDINGNAIGDGTLELLTFTETASAVNQVNVANAATGGAPVLSAVGDDTNIGLTLTPKGTGNITLGTMVFNSDQTIGAGQDNYVLTYDNGTGLISLEAAAGGGAASSLEYLGNSVATAQAGGLLVQDDSGSVADIDFASSTGTALGRLVATTSGFSFGASVNSASVSMTSLSSGGVARFLFLGDPDGESQMYRSGGIAMGTASLGGFVRDTAGSNPLLRFQNNSGGDEGWLYFGASGGYLRNYQNSQNFRFLMNNGAGTAVKIIDMSATGIGFYGTGPQAQPTSVAVTAAGIHAALVTLGLIT